MRTETKAYLLFAVIGFAQLGTLILIGDSTFSAKGVMAIVLMVAWLGRRSRTAWWIFVLFNAFELIATVALVLGSATGAQGGILWADVITMLLGSAVLIAILLTRPMRSWSQKPAVT